MQSNSALTTVQEKQKSLFSRPSKSVLDSYFIKKPVCCNCIFYLFHLIKCPAVYPISIGYNELVKEIDNKQ